MDAAQFLLTLARCDSVMQAEFTLVARGLRRSLLPQPFDETLLLEPVYKRTIDELF